MRIIVSIAFCVLLISAPDARAQFGPFLDLAYLDGTDAKRFIGELRFSGTGDQATVGDLNDDGRLDLIIAAPWDGLVRERGESDYFPGTVYVVFGGPWFDQVVSAGMEQLDGTNGFAIEGLDSGGHFGRSVVSGFDWNADGIDDMAVGASLGRVDSVIEGGQVFVIFGHESIGLSGHFDLAALDGTSGFVIDGIATLDHLGRSLAAGDFNADDWPDLAIGATGFTLPGRSEAGQVFVVFGGPGVGAGGSFDLTTLDGTNGFVVNGIAEDDDSSRALTNPGDLNNDGVDDLAMGAWGADPSGWSNAGQSYVLFGGPGIGGDGVIELADLDGTNGFVINGPWPNAHAYQVSAGGDVNGDAIADLVVGHEAVGGYQARSAVIFGGPGVGSTGVVDIATLAWPAGVQVVGAGYHGAGVRDINDDGLGEVALFHEQASPLGRFEAGIVKVVFGHPQMGADGPVDVDALDGTNGFYVYGDQNALRLSKTHPLGDLNRDGIADFGIYGFYDRPDAPSGDWDHGAVYVVFGRSPYAQGDLDRDNDVDVADFQRFAQCFAGADNPPAFGCEEPLRSDFDHDADVDLSDFAIFAQNFTGAQ
jgi:hypothetical protein